MYFQSNTLDFAQLCAEMISQIRAKGFREERILSAFSEVPREEFVPSHLKTQAYEDSPLSIGFEQTISQPYVVALMLGLAEIRKGSRVLEIGTGSGYSAALLSKLASEVYTIERQKELFESSRQRLEDLSYHNVSARWGDGSEGWTDKAPFDAILVSAATETIPPRLLSQLQIGGRLVLPIGRRQEAQRLLKIVRLGQERYESKDCGAVSFVPLVPSV